MLIHNKDEKLNNELLFLIVCCQTDQSEKDIEFILSILNSNKFNSDSLLNLANQHGVLPLVYKTLKNLHIDKPSHQELLTNLKSIYTQIAHRNILMSAELINLIKLLDDNDIAALSFKGPTLSQIAYGDITLRQFGDLDILIRKKDRYKMMDILIEKGYIPEIDLKQKTKETFFNCVNVIGFHKPSTGTRVEIHWELLSKNYAINWDEKTLWKKQAGCIINQKNIPILNLEYLLLYLCAHGAKHLFERLEWICDIDRTIRANPSIDWSYLLNEAEKLGIKRILFLGLFLSKQFFALKLPEEIQKLIDQESTLPILKDKIIEANFSDTSLPGQSYSSFGLLWNMRENLKDRLRFAKYGLFSTTGVDFEFIQLSRYLAFLYPIIRPFRLITKYFKH